MNYTKWHPIGLKSVCVIHLKQVWSEKYVIYIYICVWETKRNEKVIKFKCPKTNQRFQRVKGRKKKLIYVISSIMKALFFNIQFDLKFDKNNCDAINCF